MKSYRDDLRTKKVPAGGRGLYDKVFESRIAPESASFRLSYGSILSVGIVKLCLTIPPA